MDCGGLPTGSFSDFVIRFTIHSGFSSGEVECLQLPITKDRRIKEKTIKFFILYYPYFWRVNAADQAHCQASPASVWLGIGSFFGTY